MLQSGASSIVGPEPSSTYGLHLPLTPPHIANGLEFQSLGTLDSCHLRRTISAPPTGVPSVPNLDTFGDDATQVRELTSFFFLFFLQGPMFSKG